MNKNILDYSEATDIAEDDYILLDSESGGTSKILASYFGSQEPPEPQWELVYNWDFTQSLVDTIKNKTVNLYEGATRNSNGINFTAQYQQAWIDQIGDLRGKMIEVDMGEVDYKGGQLSTTCQFIQVPITDSSTTSYSRGYSLLAYSGGNGWSAYGSDNYNSLDNRHWGNMYSADLSGSSTALMNVFSNKTIKLVISEDGSSVTLYIDGELKGSVTNVYSVNETKALAFNNSNDRYKTSTTQARYYNSIIKALRIYKLQ